MRLYFTLILATVLIAFCDGFLFLTLKNTSFSTEVTATTVARDRVRFVASHLPIYVLDLTAVYPSEAHFALLDPTTALPHTVRHPLAEMQAIYRYATTCRDDGTAHKVSSEDIAKAWTWHRYRCGALRELPEGFFSSPPFVHPTGKSYAWLNGANPADSKSMHWSELRKMRARGELAMPFALLADLDSFAIRAVIDGAESVLSDRYLLLRKQRPLSSPGLSTYLVYPRQEWEAFLSPLALAASPYREAKSCHLREGAVCWNYTTSKLKYLFNQSSLLVFLQLSALICLIAWVLVRKIGEEKRDRERRRFALQTLAHELRTPLAGVSLSVEALRGSFDSLGEQDQVGFLRLCDAVQRLGRVVEASKQYLTSHSGEKFIALEPRDIPSFNELVDFAVAPFRERIELLPSPNDGPIRCDPYWVSVCIKNLVENALKHGRPPVRVRWWAEPKLFSVAVSDEGRGLALKLRWVAEPFVKGASSDGLGLGLSIVQDIVKEMHGTLELMNDPTTFTLRLRQ